MSRGRALLSAVKVAKLKEEGLHPDGGGLYLQISAAGARSWLYRYALNKRSRYMGLGSYPSVSLAEARQAADCARRLRDSGVDPIDDRERRQRLEASDQERAVSFSQAAERCIAEKKPGWRNSKHADQWTNTLKTYAYPFIENLPVGEVAVSHVKEILGPIWYTKNETASRVRGRIESVLDWAAVSGMRKPENPARWRGHLDQIYRPRSKVQRVEHHAALPYNDVSSFMLALRKRDGVSSYALQFVILTACRTNEGLKAVWEEFDLDKAIWTVPAARMKGNREHRVPLTQPVIDILRHLEKMRVSNFIFPSIKDKASLSSHALLMLLRRMNRSDLTVHGFRSTFRDWAAEETEHPSEVIEMALAHSIPNKAEAAYRRGDLIEKRRHLMTDWAEHCVAVVAQGGATHT